MASANFINECKNRANANRLGQIVVEGVATPITQSNNLQSFEIDSGCYVDGNIIGSVYIKCLKANFINDQNNLDSKTVTVQAGVKYADLSTEYVNVGKYTIEHPNNEITANMSQITAYDKLYTNLDNKYICNIDYSTGDKTVSDLYIDVCNQLGLTPVTTTFINSTIPIADNPFTNGEKNRTVLEAIGKVSCSFVDIDVDDDKIGLCWLSTSEEPDYTFYKNDYSSVDGGQVVCGPINCLTIKNGQIDDENVTIKDNESIEANGEHSLIMSEDYILYNTDLRQQAITAIWNRVKGMKYVDCKLTTYYGKPFLKLGDKIRIYTSETDYFDTYVLKHKFTYDGSFASVIESPALSEQEIKTKQDVSLAEKLRNTQAIVNKQEGKINFLIDEVNEQSNALYGTIEKIENLNIDIDGVTNTLKTIGGGNLIKDSLGALNDGSWTGNVTSAANTFALENSIAGQCISLNNGSIEQQIQLANGVYTLSFKYKKNIVNAVVKININGTDYELTQTNLTEFEKQINIVDNNLKIKFTSDTNDSCYVLDLICNFGETKDIWTQNMNEAVTETVKIGKGIQVESSATNTYWRAGSDGSRVFNRTTNKVVREDTDKGTITEEFESKSTSKVNGVLFVRTGKHRWISGV